MVPSIVVKGVRLLSRVDVVESLGVVLVAALDEVLLDKLVVVDLDFGIV